MKIKTIITTLLLMATVVVSAQGLKGNIDEGRKAEVRKTLALDYSMPDYSTNKIDAKVMGQRLAMILTKIQEDYTQQTNLNALSIIQSSQVEGLSYGRIKSMKLDKVSKKGNIITISFITTLEPNNLNMKKSKLVFNFVDGVSDDMATNDFFTSVCRYIKE